MDLHENTALHRRPTETFPIPARGAIRFFRRMSRVRNIFRQVGRRGYFVLDITRGLGEPGTWIADVFHQMRVIGVDSVPLTVLVAAFIGGVIAVQTRYQLFAGVELSVVGLATRQTIILEMGPLLTGLVLTGRVGARMTAEIGTMRVTEQIDALETLAYDPVAYLIVPRVLAAIIMLPILVIIADAIGVLSGFAIGVTMTDITSQDFTEGLRLAFSNFQVFYSLLKATMFGAAIGILCSYEGYITGAGAEGVGRSTARAVVFTSVAILVLDALTAAALGQYLQA
jgi:phospholipid/cholesterol/gamma-HCH transport system permease protein